MSAGGALVYGLACRARGSLRQLRRESRLKTLVLAGAMVGLFAGLEWVLELGLSFLAHHGAYQGLRHHVHQIGFLVFFYCLGIMLVISVALTAHGAFFRSRETDLLCTHPVPLSLVTGARLLEAGAFSTWAFLFLSAPLLLAYGRVEGGGARLWVAGGASLLLFCLLAVGIGGAIDLTMATVSRGTRRWAAGLLGAGAAVLGLVVVPVLTWRTWLSGVEQETVFQLLDRFSLTDHPLLPSRWVTRAWLGAGRGDLAGASFYVGVLGSWAAFSMMGALALGGRLLLRARSWGESGGGGGTPIRERIVRWAGPVLRRLGGPYAPVLEKDVLTFLRDPAQWSQFLVFAGLLAIYFVNIRRIGGLREEAAWRALVATLNFGATSLTLCTFTSRFVYPMVSLEGRRFWILGLLPLSRSGLLRVKFASSCLASVAVSGALIWLSDRTLGVPAWMACVHGVMVPMIGIGLSGLAVGLGAIFPDFRAESPARVVSSFGGTLNLLLGLAYLTAMTSLLAIPVVLGEVPRLVGRTGLSHGAFLAAAIGSVVMAAGVTAAAAWIPMRIGRRALDAAEF